MTFHCLSRFHLLHPLGSGAGTVFRAEDLQLGRETAVKLLPKSLCHDLRALEELKLTAGLIASLRHPNICAIQELDESEGQHFVVMELLEGEPLGEHLARGTADMTLVVRVGVQTADALDAAHGVGVVHGNLTPNKIFLTRKGDVKILDFCLRHVRGHRGWRAHAAPDTMAYAAPEELLDRPIDARTDLFSLGVVLYQMATGRRPFTGSTPNSLADSILHRAPVRALDAAPQLPAGVDWAIHRCLEKLPEHRYQSAEELRKDLLRVGSLLTP
jgi:non-specific serine/threonine protein kinase